MRRLRAVQWGEVPAFAGMTVMGAREWRRASAGHGAVGERTASPSLLARRGRPLRCSALARRLGGEIPAYAGMTV